MSESKRGGARPGAGRKRLGTKNVLVKLNDGQHQTFKKLGGSVWLQRRLDTIENISERIVQMTTAQEIIDMLKDEIQDATSREEWQKRAIDVLEDGAALAALGLTDEDQLAIEETHCRLKTNKF